MTTGECDCCGKLSNTISRCWYGNIETFACAECRGIDPTDYDEPAESKCVAEHMGGKRCVGKCLCPRDCCEKPLDPRQYEHEEKLEKAMDRYFGSKP